MDTREKILSMDEALAMAANLRAKKIEFHAVTGYFDVLQPAMVRRLQQLAADGTRLFAVVLNPEEPLLPERARAELAAGLRMIDYVILSPGDPTGLIRGMKPREWIREEAAHGESTEQLIEHVFQRHSLTRERRPTH